MYVSRLFAICLVRLKCLSIVVVAVAVVAGANTAWGTLTNGGFDDLSGTFPNNWVPLVGGRVNPGLQHPPLDGGSGTAVLIPQWPSGAPQGQLGQSFAANGPEWELDFYFAAADPGLGGTRGLNIGIRTQAGGAQQINFRVSETGKIEAHDHVLSWTTIDNGVVSYSVDGDSSNDYTDHASDVLNIHRIRFVGHYDLVNPTYDILLSNAGSNNVFDNQYLGLQLFSGSGDPSQGAGILEMSLEQSSASTADYILDGMILTTVPEPAALVMLAVGAMMSCVPRRRRSDS